MQHSMAAYKPEQKQSHSDDVKWGDLIRDFIGTHTALTISNLISKVYTAITHLFHGLALKQYS